jgi:hypothetical protein
MVYETKIGNDKILHKNHLEHFHNSYKDEHVDNVAKDMDDK